MSAYEEDFESTGSDDSSSPRGNGTRPYVAPVPSVDPVDVAIQKVLEGGVWKKVPDPRTGKHYYYHSITKQTTWDLAKELGFGTGGGRQLLSGNNSRDLDVMSDVGGVPKLKLAPREKNNSRMDAHSSVTSFGNMPAHNPHTSLEPPQRSDDGRSSSGSSGLPPDPLLTSSRRWGTFGATEMGFNDSKAVGGLNGSRRGGGTFGEAFTEAARGATANESLMPEEEDGFGGLQTYVAFGSPSATPLAMPPDRSGSSPAQAVVHPRIDAYDSDFEHSGENYSGDVEGKMMEARRQKSQPLGSFRNAAFKGFAESSNDIPDNNPNNRSTSLSAPKQKELATRTSTTPAMAAIPGPTTVEVAELARPSSDGKSNNQQKEPTTKKSTHLAVETDSDSAFSSVGGAAARIAEDARRKAEDEARRERDAAARKNLADAAQTIQIAIPTSAAPAAAVQSNGLSPSLGLSGPLPVVQQPHQQLSGRQALSAQTASNWQGAQAPVLPSASNAPISTSVPSGLSAQHQPSLLLQEQLAALLSAQKEAAAAAAPNSELLQTAEALERLVKAFVTLKDGDSSRRRGRAVGGVTSRRVPRRGDDDDDYAGQLHALRFASQTRLPDENFFNPFSKNPRTAHSEYQAAGTPYLLGRETTTRPTSGPLSGGAKLLDAVERRRRHHHAVVKSSVFRKVDDGGAEAGFDGDGPIDQIDEGDDDANAFAQHCAVRDAANENSSALEEEILDAVLAMMLSSPKAQGSHRRPVDRRQARFEDAPEYLNMSGGGVVEGARSVRSGRGGGNDELVSNVVGVDQFQCYSSAHNARAGLSTGVPRPRFAAAERFIEPIDALDDIATAFYRDGGSSVSMSIECASSETPTALSSLLEENLNKYLLRHIRLSGGGGGLLSPHLGKMILLDLLRVCLDILVTRFPGSGREGDNAQLPLNRRDPIVLVYEGPTTAAAPRKQEGQGLTEQQRSEASFALFESCKRTITSLPFEPLEANSHADPTASASESLSSRKPRYRLEHWVTKGHLWAMIHALQWTLRKLERVSNDPYHAFFHANEGTSTVSKDTSDPTIKAALDLCDASVVAAELPLFSLAPSSLLRMTSDASQPNGSRESNFGATQDIQDPRRSNAAVKSAKSSAGPPLFGVEEDHLEVLAFAASTLGSDVYREIANLKPQSSAAGGVSSGKENAADGAEIDPLLVPPAMPQGMRQTLATQMVVETIQELLADPNIAASVQRRAVAKATSLMGERDKRWVERRQTQMEENRLAANYLAAGAAASGVKPSPAAVRQAATSAAALQKAKEKGEERRRAEAQAVEERIGRMIDRMKEEVTKQAL